MVLPFARALPTETKVERGTSQSKSGTSVNLCDSGKTGWGQVSLHLEDFDARLEQAGLDLAQFAHLVQHRALQGLPGE